MTDLPESVRRANLVATIKFLTRTARDDNRLDQIAAMVRRNHAAGELSDADVALLEAEIGRHRGRAPSSGK
jgi:hypothetical protein